MKCCYCCENVLSGEPLTVPGTGPAHRSCYEKNLIEQRIFRQLNLRGLPDAELRELADMVQMELNVRNAEQSGIDLWQQDDVLFV